MHTYHKHMNSISTYVREFTQGAGQECPDHPCAMTLEEVNFISKMVLDELMELYATVSSSEQAESLVKEMIDTGKKHTQTVYSSDEVGHVSKIADQVDALVDIEYYLQNGACKKGM